MTTGATPIDIPKLLKLYTLKAKLLGIDVYMWTDCIYIDPPGHYLYCTFSTSWCRYATKDISINTYPGYHEEIFEMFLIKLTKQRPLS